MRASARNASRSTPLLSGLIALALAGLGSPAHGGGLEVGDTGAEAMGRGGAFVAKADNPATINYNPAGFVKLRGHHISVGGNLVHAAHSFTRSGYLDSDGTKPYPTVDNAAPWFATPRYMVVTSDLGLFDRWTFAGGFYAPPAAGSAYPEQIEIEGKKLSAPQRFTALETSGLILFPTFAVAYRPTDWIDIGLSFQWVVTKVQATQIGTVGMVCDQPEDPQCDVRVKLDVSDMFSPTGSAGVLLRPTRNLEIGGMIRLPSEADLKGNAKIDLGPALKKLEGGLVVPMISPLDPEISMSNSYPWMIRAGARYVFRHGDEEFADIEANFIWENWSAASKRVVLIKGQSMGKEMEPQVVDWKLNDTVALRLGGSYKLRISNSLELVLRAGAFAETASTDVSDSSLGVFGPKRIGLTSGMGIRWGRYQVDTAYAHVFFPKRVVNQSTVTAQDFSGNTGPVVGNGTYSASVDIFSIQLSVAFGDGYNPAPSRRPTQPVVPKNLRPEEDDEEIERRIEQEFEDEDEDPEPIQQQRNKEDDLGFTVETTAAQTPPPRTPKKVAKPRPRANRKRGPLEFDPEEIHLTAEAERTEEKALSAKRASEDLVRQAFEQKSRMLHPGAPKGREEPELSRRALRKKRRRWRRHRRSARKYRRYRARAKRRAARKYRRQRRRYLRGQVKAPANACLRWDAEGRCVAFKRWFLRKLRRRARHTALLVR